VQWPEGGVVGAAAATNTGCGAAVAVNPYKTEITVLAAKIAANATRSTLLIFRLFTSIASFG